VLGVIYKPYVAVAVAVVLMGCSGGYASADLADDDVAESDLDLLEQELDEAYIRVNELEQRLRDVDAALGSIENDIESALIEMEAGNFQAAYDFAYEALRELRNAQ
jgi:hypothetical protein